MTEGQQAVPEGHLLHVALSEEWREAQAEGSYRRSTLGASLDEVGFVHCSADPDQVAAVGDAVYASVAESLVLLVVDPARLDAEVRYEDLDGSGTEFPHVYGPIPVGAVVATAPVRAGDGSFDVVWSGLAPTRSR